MILQDTLSVIIDTENSTGRSGFTRKGRKKKEKKKGASQIASWPIYQKVTKKRNRTDLAMMVMMMIGAGMCPSRAGKEGS